MLWDISRMSVWRSVGSGMWAYPWLLVSVGVGGVGVGGEWGVGVVWVGVIVVGVGGHRWEACALYPPRRSVKASFDAAG
jgi:hypothetical protein